MWVRAVAVALAVGCWAVGGAQAAQYSEMWNPPETRHAPGREKAHAPAGKKAAGKGAGVAGKNKPHKHAPKQVAPRAGHKAAPDAGHKTATRAGHAAKTHTKVVAKGEPKKSLKMAQSKGAHLHAAAHPKVRNVAAQPAASGGNLPPILH